MEKHDIIDRYSDMNHLLGDPTNAEAIALPLISPVEPVEMSGISIVPVVAMSAVPMVAARSHPESQICLLNQDHHAVESNGAFLVLRCGDKVRITDFIVDGKSSMNASERANDKFTGVWRGHLLRDSSRLVWIPERKLVPEFARQQQQHDLFELQGDKDYARERP